MISTGQLIAMVVVAVCLYLIFYVIPMPATVRNVLGIVFAVVLFVLVINLLLGLFPF